MSAPDDPARWPDAPPPLPPTLPTDTVPGPIGGWTSGPVTPPPAAPPGAPASFAAPPPAGPPPAPPSGTRTGLIAAVVAVVVVLALAGTFLAVRTVRSEDTAAPTTTESPTTTDETEPRSSTTDDPDDPDDPTGSGTGGADISAEVTEISRFVEEERGLTFKEPVEVEALGAEEFKARVLEEFEAEQEALETEAAFLRASGLVPADLDIVQTQLDLYGEGVAGFYDPVSKELVVRADSSGPLVRSVIAHELTHAIDDQHFDLDRPELAERNDGTDWAFSALVEGNARYIEHAYIDQFTAAEQEQYAQDQLELSGGQMDLLFSVPMVLIQMLMSPYDYGAPFVDELIAAGGQARLDEAYREPPTSSEQVLDITKFDGDQPIDVPTPPAEGEVITEGVLGELSTGYLLAGGGGFDDLLGGIDPGALDDLTGDLEALEEMMGDLEELQDLIDSLEDGTADPDEVLERLEEMQEQFDTTDEGTEPTVPGGSTDSTVPDDLGGLDDLEGLEDLGGLGDLGGTGTLDSGFPPVATTDGWGGDRYVVWRANGEVCLRVDWVMDTPEALTTFRGDVTAWAARDAAVTVTEPTAESVRATRCAPEPASAGR